MNLRDDLQRQLDRLARQSLSCENLADIAVAGEGGRFTGQLSAVDGIGCAFERLSLETDRLAGAPVDRLKAISDALARRLHYLLEPITPIEIDGQQCTVQMRSNPPQQDENGRRYYELLVSRSGIQLARYEKAPGAPRTGIPGQVTREVLARLAEDFFAAVE